MDYLKKINLKPKKPFRSMYKKENLKEALMAIESGMPVNMASRRYSIPRTILHSKKRARLAKLSPTPDTVLSPAEEKSLVQWIIHCNEQSLPVSKQHLLNSVAMLVKGMNRQNPFGNGRPGRHWYQSFLRRHAHVSDKLSENSRIARNPASEEDIRGWFAKTSERLKSKRLLDLPASRMFVVENVPLAGLDGDDEKESLSLYIAGSADGRLAPCMVLCDGEVKPEGKTLPGSWLCRSSNNGTASAEYFHEYVTRTFFLWLCDSGIVFPVVLFLNGRVSYLTLDLTEFCIRNKIELVALHPNSPHVLQPMEVFLFPSLRAVWKATLDNYRLEGKFNELTSKDVVISLKKIIDSFDISKFMKSGFKVCGLCPLSESSCHFERMQKKVVGKNQKMVIMPYRTDELFMTSMKNQNVMYSQFLDYIEESIDAKTFESFKNINETDEWTGRVEDTSLFYLWRKISRVKKMNDELNAQKDNENVNDTQSKSMVDNNSHLAINENISMNTESDDSTSIEDALDFENI